MRNWLLLRGLAREQRHWGSFVDQFCDEVPGTRVHCLDFPGVGTECERSCPMSVDNIMGDLRRRWEALRDEHDGPWSLLAISLGGMVAMHWCATHADDFDHLVVMNSSTRDLSAPHKRLSLDVLPKMIGAAMADDPVEREKMILEFTARMAPNHDEVARRAATFFEDAPVKRRTALKQLIAAAFFATPEVIETPTLVLAAAKDPLADPRCAFRLSRHLEAPLCVHPRAGHDLSLDAPGWIIRQVSAWLDGRGELESVASPKAEAV